MQYVCVSCVSSVCSQFIVLALDAIAVVVGSVFMLYYIVYTTLCSNAIKCVSHRTLISAMKAGFLVICPRCGRRDEGNKIVIAATKTNPCILPACRVHHIHICDINAVTNHTIHMRVCVVWNM